MITKEYSYIQEMTKLMFEITNDSDLFITLKVKELIWGYTDPMLAAVKKIFNKFDLPYDDHFGFFYKVSIGWPMFGVVFIQSPVITVPGMAVFSKL